MSLKSRREFLRTGFLSAMFMGAAPFTPRPANAAVESKNEGRAKNMIFLVSDGMSTGTLTMADLMLRRMEGRSSNWARMYSEGRAKRGLMDMASANRIVTDSAAAAASWGWIDLFKETYLSRNCSRYRAASRSSSMLFTVTRPEPFRLLSQMVRISVTPG